MKNISTFLQITIICILSFSCSKTDQALMPELKTTTEVEKLFQHSEEFIQKVYSYENGIHAAVGYGIANSYLIEGSGLNIIIDATDSVFHPCIELRLDYRTQLNFLSKPTGMA